MSRNDTVAGAWWSGEKAAEKVNTTARQSSEAGLSSLLDGIISELPLDKLFNEQLLKWFLFDI